MSQFCVDSPALKPNKMVLRRQAHHALRFSTTLPLRIVKGMPKPRF
jgi:hypothetical protein